MFDVLKPNFVVNHVGNESNSTYIKPALANSHQWKQKIIDRKQYADSPETLSWCFLASRTKNKSPESDRTKRKRGEEAAIGG